MGASASEGGRAITDGAFKRISWDEALDEIARPFSPHHLPSTDRKPFFPIPMEARWAR